MGLDLIVGILADSKGSDVEGYEYFKAQFEAVNNALQAEGLPTHHEPEDAKEPLPWSHQMWGYSGLHYLRRIAANLWIRNELAEPGDENAHEDPALRDCYEELADLSSASKFPHLIYHSDAEGFYLPIPFDDVIFPDEELDVAGGMIGSSHMLMDECSRLAQILELPLDLDIEAEEVWEAADSQGEGETKWQRYGIESFTCLRLYHACKVSIESTCAVVFT